MTRKGFIEAWRKIPPAKEKTDQVSDSHPVFFVYELLASTFVSQFIYCTGSHARPRVRAVRSLENSRFRWDSEDSVGPTYIFHCETSSKPWAGLLYWIVGVIYFGVVIRANLFHIGRWCCISTVFFSTTHWCWSSWPSKREWIFAKLVWNPFKTGLVQYLCKASKPLLWQPSKSCICVRDSY